MPYSYPDNVPQFAKKKSAAVKKVVVEVFNETLSKENSEQKARIAALAAMKNAEESENKTKVTKAVNEELMQVTYVAMKPGVDLHGDLVELEDIRLAAESFNKSAKRANLFHMVMTDKFEILESYLMPCDAELNGNFVQKGEWLVTLQIKDNDLWEMIKSEDINGVSIGAMAICEQIE